MPVVILPGTVQLARSPLQATSSPPSTAVSTCPPRIIAKDRAESNTEPPGRMVTVCLPALMIWGSTSSSYGKGPMPRRPFSECRVTSTPGGMWLATSVGMPIPRFTTWPSGSSAAARRSMSSLLQLTGAPSLRAW
jgi:hypothetical protein